jgi:hypothetical protein
MVSPVPLMVIMEKILPGLMNFCMAGKRVQPDGGIPRYANSGRGIATRISNTE